MNIPDHVGHIHEDRLVEISQKSETLLEEMEHLAVCEQCGRLLAAFLRVQRPDA
jgi:hypothetical protein